MTKNAIKMQWAKSTKGTHVYENNDPGSPISSVYIKRSGLPSAAPGSITVTIEYEEVSNSA